MSRRGETGNRMRFVSDIAAFVLKGNVTPTNQNEVDHKNTVRSADIDIIIKLH